jgi:hypothetical protein
MLHLKKYQARIKLYSFRRLMPKLGAALLLILFSKTSLVSAQAAKDTSKTKLLTYEVQAAALIRQSLTATDDEQKIAINTQLQKTIEKLLNEPESVTAALDSLKKYRIIQFSADNELRIINWDLTLEDKTHRYFGYIQHLDSKNKQWHLFKLTDASEDIKNPENAVLSKDKWFGAYYYKIVIAEHKKKKYYTLLGWDGNDRITQKKLIDVLYFEKNGEPKFGDAIFEVHKTVGANDKLLVVFQKRVFFEYGKKVSMSVKYDPVSEQIIYDHLSPDEESKKGQYQFYGPDLSLDAYTFKRGKWQLISNSEAGRNEKSKTDKLYKDPKEYSPPQLK